MTGETKEPLVGWLTFGVMLAVIAVALFVFSSRKDLPTLSIAGVVAALFSLACFGFSMFVVVDDGSVGVTRAFGQYDNAILDAGFHVIAPWEDVTTVDTKLQSFTFASPNNDNGEVTETVVSDPITAQARGGGNLTIELTLQATVNPNKAAEMLRRVGSNWFSQMVVAPVRSCTRDAPSTLTLEEAYSSKRSVIGANTVECVTASTQRIGDYVNIIDVLVREVDPGEAVKESIDAKQQAEQDLQAAAIEVKKAEEEARKEAVKAFGTSQAEQIVACGGVPTTRTVDGEEQTVIVPNDECNDQFSTEYLQWLYITQLSEIDGVVVLPPEFEGELFVQTPTLAPIAP